MGEFSYCVNPIKTTIYGEWETMNMTGIHISTGLFVRYSQQLFCGCAIKHRLNMNAALSKARDTWLGARHLATIFLNMHVSSTYLSLLDLQRALSGIVQELSLRSVRQRKEWLQIHTSLVMTKHTYLSPCM